MEMTIEQPPAKVPVTILGLQGDLDYSNFEDVIAKAKELYESGMRNLLIDMSNLQFMSSSGLVALHSIVLLMRGEQPHDLQSGWEAFHAIDRDRGRGLQPSVKLYNPQSKVDLTLKKSGMDEFFEIHTDLQTAIASF